MIKPGYEDWVRLCVEDFRKTNIEIMREEIYRYTTQKKIDQVMNCELMMNQMEKYELEDLLPIMLGLARKLSIAKLSMKKLSCEKEVPHWTKNILH